MFQEVLRLHIGGFLPLATRPSWNLWPNAKQKQSILTKTEVDWSILKTFPIVIQTPPEMIKTWVVFRGGSGRCSWMSRDMLPSRGGIPERTIPQQTSKTQSLEPATKQRQSPRKSNGTYSKTNTNTKSPKNHPNQSGIPKKKQRFVFGLPRLLPAEATFL